MPDEVIYEENDILTERNLGIVIGQPPISNYRARGCDVSLDPNSNNIDVASDDPDGDVAVATDANGHGHILLPDRRLDVDLATTTGENYVYLVHDPTAAAEDNISVIVRDTRQSPSGSSVLIAEVDPVTDVVSQPPVGGGDMVADDLDVAGSVSVGGDSLVEVIEDTAASLTTAGDKMAVSYDDDAETLTIGTDALDRSEVEDATAALIDGGDNISVTYDSASDSLQVDTSALNGEEVQDAVAALLVGGDKLTLSYDDAGDTVTVDTSALDAEEVRDEVGALLSGGAGIDITVDDAGDTVSIGVPASGIDSAQLADDAVGVAEIDQSVSPTWTAVHEFTAGITGLPSPTAGTDAATKEYVDAIEQGLDIKDSVRTASAGVSVDLTSTADPNPIDGVTISDGDRILLKDQADAAANGIYEAATAADPTTWVRAPDAAGDNMTSGLFVFVEEGTDNLNRGFVLTSDDPITVGTTPVTFTQFSGAGQITAGNALTKTGDRVDVDESAISHDSIAAVSAGDHRTDEQVRDLAGGMAGTALAHDDAGDSVDVQREQIEDWVGGLVAEQGNISVTYDDANDVLQVDTSALNEEEVQDAVSQLVTAGDNLSWNYDDANDALTVALSGPVTGVQIGTDSNRSDAYLDTADAKSVSTGDLDTGRSWTDVSASRSFDTSFTNNTESEIKVQGRVAPSSDSTTVNVAAEVNNKDIFQHETTKNTGEDIPFIITSVPPGGSYILEAFGDASSYDILDWFEFRP